MCRLVARGAPDHRSPLAATILTTSLRHKHNVSGACRNGNQVPINSRTARKYTGITYIYLLPVNQVILCQQKYKRETLPLMPSGIKYRYLLKRF